MATGAPLPQRSAEGFPGRQPHGPPRAPQCARATAHGAPPPPAPHVTRRSMTNGPPSSSWRRAPPRGEPLPPGVTARPRCPVTPPRLSPPGVSSCHPPDCRCWVSCHCSVSCHPPGFSLPGAPPVTPWAVTAQCAVTPRASHCPVSLLSPPSQGCHHSVSCYPLGLWCFSQQPWAHHHLMSCHSPDLSPPCVLSPPGPAVSLLPPHWTFATQCHLPQAPGPVVPLPTALGPSLPDVLSPLRPVTAWHPVTPWACGVPAVTPQCPSCHLLGCHPPVSPPASSQPGQGSLGGDAAGFAVWRWAAHALGPAKGGDIPPGTTGASGGFNLPSCLWETTAAIPSFPTLMKKRHGRPVGLHFCSERPRQSSVWVRPPHCQSPMEE